MRLIPTLAAAVLAAGAAAADPISYTDLPLDTLIFDDINSDNYYDSTYPGEVDYWKLDVRQGWSYTATARRLEETADLLMYVFSTTWSRTGEFNYSFLDGVPAHLWVATGDDEIREPDGYGYWGDPQVSFTAATTGSYTLVIGSHDTGEYLDDGGDGRYDYTLLVEATPVPLPAPLTLLAGAVGALALMRRLRA